MTALVLLALAAILAGVVVHLTAANGRLTLEIYASLTGRRLQQSDVEQTHDDPRR
jgi:hypothetical protein